MSIFCLPLELREEILIRLEDVQDLSNAFLAWKGWKTKGILKRWCQRYIHEDALYDLSGTVEGESVDWEAVFSKWAIRIVEEEEEEGRDGVHCAANPIKVKSWSSGGAYSARVSGDIVVMDEAAPGSGVHQVTFYTWAEGGRLLTTLEPNVWEDNEIQCLGLLNISGDPTYVVIDEEASKRYLVEHDAVVLFGTWTVSIYWMLRDVRHCYVRGTKLCPHRGRCSHPFYRRIEEERLPIEVSFDGSRFAFMSSISSTQNEIVALFVCNSKSQHATKSGKNRIVVEGEKQINVVHCQFRPPRKAVSLEFFNKRLLFVLDDGTIMRHVFSDGEGEYTWHGADVMGQFPQLRYPFRNFFYRRLLFFDVKIASWLLGYWHVDTGCPHWMVSTDDGVTLRRINTSVDTDRVTAICVKGAIVVLGTAEGRIIVFHHHQGDHLLPEVIVHRLQQSTHLMEDPSQSNSMQLGARWIELKLELSTSIVELDVGLLSGVVNGDNAHSTGGELLVTVLTNELDVYLLPFPTC